MNAFFQLLFDWYIANLNYFTIALLMAIESTFLPLPSEVVIPFAAFKAAQGDLNVFLVVLFGTIGALIGSLFNYYLAKYLGRILVYKLANTNFAKIFLINQQKVEDAETYFIKNGKTSTFIGRLLPGIRHLISIPAGLAKMNIKDFMLYTFLGAGIWNIILALIGYFLYDIKDQIFPYLGYIFIFIGILFLAYLILNKLRKARVSQMK